MPDQTVAEILANLKKIEEGKLTSDKIAELKTPTKIAPKREVSTVADQKMAIIKEFGGEANIPVTHKYWKLR